MLGLTSIESIWFGDLLANPVGDSYPRMVRTGQVAVQTRAGDITPKTNSSYRLLEKYNLDGSSTPAEQLST